MGTVTEPFAKRVAKMSRVAHKVHDLFANKSERDVWNLHQIKWMELIPLRLSDVLFSDEGFKYNGN